MTRSFGMLSGTVVLSLTLAVSVVEIAHAAPPVGAPAATKNSCWGQVASAFARLAPGTFGEHSRASSPFTATPSALGGDGDPPFNRKGVANQSRFLEDIGVAENGEPGQGGNGDHAIANTNNTPLANTEVANCEGPPTP